MADQKKNPKHFVLVHGLCHGAWCWYKLKPQLESAGHKVTALDLAASGINTKTIGHDVSTFHDYTRPLLGGATEEFWQDSEIVTIPEKPFTLTTLGPKFMATNLYQLSPVEDLELAKTLVRPGSRFEQELSKAKNFSNEGYGSVTRVYVACNEDKTITQESQRWMIQNNPPKDVFEIQGADHMGMLSKPTQVCDCLLEIANKYA
ncbi:putative Polyneuridine-aldehyde esterase precursor [Corchorus olitorius]|uniref:Polyneuridine-aldehyde esterase n=1 Tax=Corchorus olitorius TaxID=93759 RepID=A0A1R3K4Z4_9ROSI|nr:putative Polyneuridine-aldehyde esterase precursor [Corchorus olitorius]